MGCPAADVGGVGVDAEDGGWDLGGELEERGAAGPARADPEIAEPLGILPE
jgi:hypothetical protein